MYLVALDYKFKSDDQNQVDDNGNELGYESFIFEWATVRPCPSKSIGLSSVSTTEGFYCTRSPEKQAGLARPSGTQSRRSGRDKKAALVRIAATGTLFAAELKNKIGIKASVRTIQRALQRVDHRVYTKMEPLTEAIKQQAWNGRRSTY
ncbi:uncharacterized protein PITG_11165 [Phytophthora infestans T30-4]|uniref:Transposase Tc1-like domain-containing protein n=1 Tax=Phytophthora infestans (strain T30-4) TaxID=403677 RepID=D0NGC1_PHYIT|nr:uncharacterized protein PITG_11165 [Phytophthora infestans T30-4]EEY57322.1 hypothetical protein PITG_11165 [Phytophthora infestans T30-4]|eukprot:XP_002901932.1 hypothetical protein PITG_11165 [Phytophthora infestans T30-4]